MAEQNVKTPKAFQFLVKNVTAHRGNSNSETVRNRDNCVEIAFPRKVLEQKLVMFSNTKHHFYVFDTVKQLETYCNVSVDKSLNEVIFGEFSQRIKFDIDDIDKGDILNVINIIKTAWRRDDGPLPPYNMRDNCSIFVFKTSVKGVHVIIDYLVDNVQKAKEFFDFTLSTIEPTHPLYLKFDARVYGKIQQFRIPGSSKVAGGLSKVPLSTVKPELHEALIRVYKKE